MENDEGKKVTKIVTGISAVLLVVGVIWQNVFDSHPNNHARDMKYLDLQIAQEQTRQIQIQADAGALPQAPAPVRPIIQQQPRQSDQADGRLSPLPLVTVPEVTGKKRFDEGNYITTFSYDIDNMYGSKVVVSNVPLTWACNTAMDCIPLMNNARGKPGVQLKIQVGPGGYIVFEPKLTY